MRECVLFCAEDLSFFQILKCVMTILLPPEGLCFNQPSGQTDHSFLLTQHEVLGLATFVEEDRINFNSSRSFLVGEKHVHTTDES